MKNMQSIHNGQPVLQALQAVAVNNAVLQANN